MSYKTNYSLNRIEHAFHNRHIKTIYQIWPLSLSMLPTLQKPLTFLHRFQWLSSNIPQEKTFKPGPNRALLGLTDSDEPGYELSRNFQRTVLIKQAEHPELIEG
jgi:hypothetical protein